MCGHYCNVLRGVGLPSGQCAVTSTTLLSAACQVLGAAFRLAEPHGVDQSFTSWWYLLSLAHWAGSGHLRSCIGMSVRTIFCNRRPGFAKI